MLRDIPVSQQEWDGEVVQSRVVDELTAESPESKNVEAAAEVLVRVDSISSAEAAPAPETPGVSPSTPAADIPSAPTASTIHPAMPPATPMTEDNAPAVEPTATPLSVEDSIPTVQLLTEPTSSPAATSPVDANGPTGHPGSPNTVTVQPLKPAEYPNASAIPVPTPPTPSTTAVMSVVQLDVPRATEPIPTVGSVDIQQPTVVASSTSAANAFHSNDMGLVEAPLPKISPLHGTAPAVAVLISDKPSPPPRITSPTAKRVLPLKPKLDPDVVYPACDPGVSCRCSPARGSCSELGYRL